MDTLEALRTRRSVRQYDPERKVSDADLETMVDCARLAASARNAQPWEFVVVREATTRARLAQLATNGAFIADAPACIAVFCRESDYFLEDGSAATQNLLVAARALGLGSCWVAGYRKPYADAVRQLLGAPDDMLLVSLVAVGYPRSIPSPMKRPLSEVLHWEKF
ncbi:MAG TPA: nitroreductase family protein [Candidatus Hydrogenedentes bacterium]|nr:nitroreductase family protein [Candidatus Hydrogenedentota bacterium]